MLIELAAAVAYVLGYACVLVHHVMEKPQGVCVGYGIILAAGMIHLGIVYYSTNNQKAPEPIAAPHQTEQDEPEQDESEQGTDDLRDG